MLRSTLGSAAPPRTADTDAVLGPTVAGRPRLWAEVVLIAVCYSAYSFVRNLVPTAEDSAMQRAVEILRAERAVGLDVEYAVNRLFVDVQWLGVTANYYYATLHFVVTIGVLVWLYVRHPGRYAKFRSLMFATTVTALLGFWLYPLAPPRMLPGYVDTVIAFNTWGLYDSSPIATMSNQFAAMPSLHTAWSLWCAVAIFTTVKRGWAKALAVAYPTVTVVVILGTANHFLLDAVGGALVLFGGFVVYETMTRAWAPANRLCRGA